jgi:hypothetical protein
MKRTKPHGKLEKLMERIVGEEPGLASVARMFLYQNDDLYKLEVLASVLNDVAPDSPLHSLAELIERLVTTPPAEQAWVKGQAFIIGPTPCTPAPGSPLYVLNKFLQDTPCLLRIEGIERAGGNIEVRATHIPLPLPLLMRKEAKGLGITDRAIEGLVEHSYAEDKILWLLWEVFYRAIDVTRLKNCPVCHKWFVDHTKNKTKIRCSARCTWQRWSWEARKEAGHGSKRKGKKV